MEKVLIGYDGSPAADAAIDDLIHACIPAPVEALVLCVADVWLPADEAAGKQINPTSPTGLTIEASARTPRVLDSDMYARARAVLEQSRTAASRGARRLALQFPTWRVTAETMADSPGWALVQKARTWKASLIVVGAHSHSAFERFFFGSAASKVVMEAPCSVRISRPHRASDHRGMRIMLAVDGSRESKQAAREVARRIWPILTEIRVVTVLDPKLETAAASRDDFVRQWVQEHVEGTKERISAMTIKVAEDLRAGGRVSEPHTFEGDPKKVLLREAEAWQADCIFLGARGLDHGGRWALGSVASAVSSRAHCSVEIVRHS